MKTLNLSQGCRRRTVGIYNFLVARFARLYPLFAVCLAFDIAIRWSYSQLPPGTAVALPYYLTMTQTWIYKILDGEALVSQFGWLPQVSWSISTEWFFYFVYPLICFALIRSKAIYSDTVLFALVGIVGISLILAIGAMSTSINAAAVSNFGAAADFGSAGFQGAQQSSFLRWLLYFSPYFRLFEFMMGCLCAAIYMKAARFPVTATEHRIGFAVLLVAILVALGGLYFVEVLGRVPQQGWTSLFGWLRYCGGYALPLAIVIFCCARYSNAITKALSGDSIVLCGELSYSIYFLHMLMIGAFRWEAAEITSAQVAVAAVIRLIVTIAATIGLSLVTWTLIEKPAKRWLYRKLSRPDFRLTRVTAQ